MTFAKIAGILVEYIKILESRVQQEKSMRQAQFPGQRKDQARARFKKAVVTGEKAMETLQKAQQAFEQAHQEVVQAYMDLEHLEREASSPVVPNLQTNANLVGTLETLTGIIEHLWNLDAGRPLENLVSARRWQQRRSKNSQTSRSTRKSTWRTSKRCTHREHHNQTGRRQARDLPVLHDQRSRGLRRPHAAIVRPGHAESQGHGTLEPHDAYSCNDPGPGRQMTCWLFWLYLSGWLWATSLGRAWPACFYQTCGYPGEGPITTLDEPRMPDQCCAPIQEHLACATARRRTKEKLVGDETCVFCKEALRPRKNCLKCCTCSTLTCSVLSTDCSNAESLPCDSSRPACWPSSIVEAVNVQRATDQGAQLAEQSRTAHRVGLPLVQVADQVEKVRWADIMDVHMSTPRSSETQVQFDSS